jgi:hypothetical protein
MSDLFSFRDSIEPEATTDPLQSKAGGGAGQTTGDDEFLDFKVHAMDGDVGSVDDVQRLEGESYLLVATGGMIFSKRVLIPAGLIERVDRDNKTLHVHRTQDEIKNAPAFDEGRYREAAYRRELENYYGR